MHNSYHSVKQMKQPKKSLINRHAVLDKDIRLLLAIYQSILCGGLSCRSVFPGLSQVKHFLSENLPLEMTSTMYLVKVLRL